MSERLPGTNRKAPRSKTKSKPAERRRGSRRNRPGSASGSGRIVFSETTTRSLRNKAREHNEEYGETAGKRVTLSMLKAVYRRGAGAFSTSHSPAVRSRDQWAQARVNAFLRLVRTGKPRNPKYTGDNDLLPRDHPRKSGRKRRDR
jgi:hypothetical protein